MRQTGRVTISDIARLSGVSAGAVSFALNGKPGVSDETRKRIVQIADEQNWRPNRSARALGTSPVNVVGLVVNRPARNLGTEAFFAQLLSGIQAGLAGTHTSMQLLMVGQPADELRTYRAWSNSQRVDGVIVLDPRINDPRLELLESLGMAGVVVGNHKSKGGRMSTVRMDDTRAASSLFGYLGALGHRRIKHVSGPAEFEQTALRAAALQSGREEFALELAETIPTNYQPDEAAEATRELLSRRLRPTAIVYDNDVMAVAGLSVAREMGVEVPSDLSIAAFDNSELALLVHPSITCLTCETFELGELAATTLLAQIHSPTLLDSVAAAQPKLAVRESSSPPASARRESR